MGSNIHNGLNDMGKFVQSGASSINAALHERMEDVSLIFSRINCLIKK